MSGRLFIRRLLTTLALSQVIALQALLLSWSGALAVASGFGGDPGFICAGTWDGRGSSGSELPGGPERHSTCLDVCLAGQLLAAVPDPDTLTVEAVAYAEVLIPAGTALSETGEVPAFSARAPPMPA
jgi:hypothetical protein